jgi:hypothetical protein
VCQSELGIDIAVYRCDAHAVGQKLRFLGEPRSKLRLILPDEYRLAFLALSQRVQFPVELLLVRRFGWRTPQYIAIDLCHGSATCQRHGNLELGAQDCQKMRHANRTGDG